MDKRTQNLIWSCLPREVRKEVKRQYRIAVNGNQYFTQCTLEYLFGYHNLTSDADGEEMLTVPRSKVQEKWYRAYEQEAKYCEAEQNPTTREELYYNRGIISVIDTLFGNKCLPDESESPKLSKVEKVGKDCNVDSSDDCKAEPKFKVGDIVRFKYCCTTSQIDGFKISDGVMLYQVGEVWAEESDLEPYTEPEEDKAEEIANKAIEPVEKQFDTILKDSFRNERRLNIAAMVIASIMGSSDWSDYRGATDEDVWRNMAKASLGVADALIAECEKGGSDGN